MNLFRALAIVLVLAWMGVAPGLAQDVPAPPQRLGLKLESDKVLGDARLRHAHDVTHIEPLSDGRRALATSRDGSVRLWDLETGKELRRYLPASGDDVWNVKLLPGEREFLSCGDDNHATRWNLETGEVVAQYKLPSTGMRLAIVPDGKQFIACDAGRSASLWDIVEGNRVHVFKGHSESVYSAAVSPDGKICVTCGEDGTVRGWDVTNGDKLWVIEKEVDPDEAPPAGGDPFGGGGAADPFGAADPVKEEVPKKEAGPGHWEDVFTVCFLPDGKHVVSCSEDAAVSMWVAATGEQVWSASVSSSAKVVACSPDGKQLAVTSDDNTIHLLSASDGKSLQVIKVPGDAHWTVAWSHDGKRLLSGGDQMIYQWDAATGKQLFPPPDDDHVKGTIERIAVSSDGKRLFAVAQQRVHVWDLLAGRQIASWAAPSDLEAMCLTPDGRRLILVGDEQLVVQDSATGKQQKQFKLGEGVRAVALSADGALVLTSDWNGRVVAWDVPTGKQLWADSAENESSGSTMQLLISGDRQRVFVLGNNKVQVRKTSDGKVGKQIDLAEGLSLKSAALLRDEQALMLFVEQGDDARLLPLAPTVERNARQFSPDETRRLVAQLGDEQFAVREQAMRRLIAGGPAVSKQLVSDSDDTEVRWRLRKIRDLVREGLLPVTMLEHVKLTKTPQSAAAHPKQPLWAMVAGYDCRATLQLGGLKGQGVALGEITSDGHSPACVAFSPDGGQLFTGNRDGTVSVFRVVE